MIDRVYDLPGPVPIDLSRPAGVDRPPLVMYLHPGGWALGDRRSDADRWERMCDHGFAVASVEYRLSGEATFPAQLEDARAALAWLRAHAGELGVDADRVGVWGSSAGAHLAALLGHGPTGAEPGVAAVVGFFGTYELGPRAASGRFSPTAVLPAFVRESGLPWPMRPTFEAVLLGVADVGDAPEAAAAASPVRHASASGPPVLLVHGEEDGMVSPDQSRWMADAVRDAGGAASLLLVGDANHEDPRFVAPEILGATAAFLAAAVVARGSSG